MSQRIGSSSRGFSLLAALLLMLLVSALSVALMYSVNTERQISSSDQEQNLARYAAEAAMEKMVADVGGLYTQTASPGLGSISALSAANNQPTISGVVFPTYNIYADADCGTATTPTCGAAPPKPYATTKTISTGPNTGLYAETIPIHMDVVAARTATGAEVHMKRDSQVALIPVFQFGVFSDSDLSFFPGPSFDFNGRVFTNGNLFLAAQTDALSFHAKISAVGEVVRSVLVNNGTALDRAKLVLVPSGAGGCDGGTQPPNAVTSTCLNLDQTMSSVASGNPYTGSQSENSSWSSIANTTFGKQIQTHWDGVTPLNLPFVGSGGNLAPWELIKRPPQPPTPDPAATAREYGMAQIRILLSDAQLDLPGGIQAGDVNLASGAAINVTGSVPANPQYLAWAKYYSPYKTTGCTDPGGCLGANDVNPGWFDPSPYPAPIGTGTAAKTGDTWPLITGWLRVEYRDINGNYTNITQEWLKLGFARGQQSPNQDASLPAPGPTGANPVHPNAILLFQKRPSQVPPGYTWMGTYSAGTAYTTNQVVVYQGVLYNNIKAGSNKTPSTQPTYWSVFPWANLTNAAVAGTAQYGWFPINMYDPREGEFATGPAGTCSVGGLMNVVELDMDNLKKWLNGTIAGSGTSVENSTQNGYIVYFSDRRGMQKPPGAAEFDGEYGYEPVVDATEANWTPHGLETADGSKNGPLTSSQLAMGGVAAGEDVNGTTFAVNSGGDTYISTHGRFNLGNGFALTNGNNNVGVANLQWPTVISGTTGNITDSPAARIIACGQVGQSNRVTGARHALKLVDGSTGHLPMTTAGVPVGITVASEQPVYVQGNYNASNNLGGSPIDWGSYTHNAAAVIADAVTLLSNSFDDRNSLVAPNSMPATRAATTTYFRMAMATGKNKPFFNPAGTATRLLEPMVAFTTSFGIWRAGATPASHPLPRITGEHVLRTLRQRYLRA